RAVLAHLANDVGAEAQARTRALGRWAKDPAVDTLIGRKLSEKYRFAEGSAYQRRALAADPAHLPAKSQLAPGLLRRGQEAEGWALVEEVHRRDGYDVVAFNLATLRGHLAKLKELRSPDFVVRMDPREAEIYGDDAIALLRQARAALDKRWGFAGARPV